MARTRVLVADDHTIVAQGLGSLLQNDFELVGIVNDGRKLLESARQTQPDIIVSDITMPVLSGLEVLGLLRAEGNNVKVIFLTMHANVHMARETLLAGASGYLVKHSAGEELIRAIHEVLGGGIYLTHEIAAGIARLFAGSPVPSSPKLTPRQREVLTLVAEGCTMKEVAAKLQLSRRTVETHKYDMMQMLDLHSTAELIRYAIDHEVPAC